MRLLPTERQKKIGLAIAKFNKDGELSIFEPCNCGSHIRHNNGGNYHEKIYLQRDAGQVFVKYDSTSEMIPEAEWEVCENWEKVIHDCGDWL